MDHVSNGGSSLSGVTLQKIASKYGDGLISSDSHPELAQQYGNIRTSNLYAVEGRLRWKIYYPGQSKRP
jgi:hypothetical protein